MKEKYGKVEGLNRIKYVSYFSTWHALFFFLNTAKEKQRNTLNFNQHAELQL